MHTIAAAIYCAAAAAAAIAAAAAAAAHANILCMRQEADRITGAQQHEADHLHQPPQSPLSSSSSSSSSSAAATTAIHVPSPSLSVSQHSQNTVHPNSMSASMPSPTPSISNPPIPSPSSSIVCHSPAPGPDAEELLSALQVHHLSAPASSTCFTATRFVLTATQVSSPPRSSANRSGPLDTPPHSTPVNPRNDAADVASVLMERFDDVEESFHIDKDEASKAVVAVHDDGAEDEREEHKQHHAPFVTETQVYDKADESSQKQDAHASSSGRLVATQSPSPRTDQQQYRHHQQQQHGTSPPVQMSHALNSLDNAEAALALALQGWSPRQRVLVRKC
jgi:hypothetical protein